jgi:hypothetical protein
MGRCRPSAADEKLDGSSQGQLCGGTSPKAPLLDVSPATLDEDHQYDQEQDAGDSTNQGGIVHFDFHSFRRQDFAFPEPFLKMRTVLAEARLSSSREDAELALKLVEVDESPGKQRNSRFT